MEAGNVAEVSSLLSQLSQWMLRTYPPVGCEGSQAAEDVVTQRLLPNGDGVYVDVGASHPIECSNTWQFYKRGWRGLLVEPLQQSWQSLLRYRPGDLLWPQAVANYTGHGRIRICGTVSSMRHDWNISQVGETICEVDTLANILARFPDIRDRCRLCSIDVEGLEKEVLEGIDWETFHPEVFVVEWIKYDVPAPDNDLAPTWRHLLEEQGYVEAARTPCNLIFHKDVT